MSNTALPSKLIQEHCKAFQEDGLSAMLGAANSVLNNYKDKKLHSLIFENLDQRAKKANLEKRPEEVLEILQFVRENSRAFHNCTPGPLQGVFVREGLKAATTAFDFEDYKLVDQLLSNIVSADMLPSDFDERSQIAYNSVVADQSQFGSGTRVEDLQRRLSLLRKCVAPFGEITRNTLIDLSLNQATLATSIGVLNLAEGFVCIAEQENSLQPNDDVFEYNQSRIGSLSQKIDDHLNLSYLNKDALMRTLESSCRDLRDKNLMELDS